jgi:hypothetical protein
VGGSRLWNPDVVVSGDATSRPRETFEEAETGTKRLRAGPDVTQDTEDVILICAAGQVFRERFRGRVSPLVEAVVEISDEVEHEDVR